MKLTNTIKKLREPISIAPLVVGRMLFGLVMFVGVLRFMLKGWVTDLYVVPAHFFKYYGFEWVKPLGEAGMYAVFGLLLITTLFIALGFLYRISTVLFFIGFTYVELIDKTTYLNHYYFISIFSLLLILVPAHRAYAVDVVLWPALKKTMVPRWTLSILLLQIGVVYFFAGLAKLNSDWLLEAMPLKIWLAAKTDFPIIGRYFDVPWVPYFFSWTGALYDLLVPFCLLSSRLRIPAYFAVVCFHLLTGFLFPIGMFPLIMILLTLLFFPANWHQTLLNRLFGKLSLVKLPVYEPQGLTKKFLLPFLAFYFLVQLILPIRHFLYPGELFWTEQGYRFSWRVMLMEKAGAAFFYVKNPKTGIEMEVRNCDYLTPFQEKMMATQPDMILEFAHIIKRDFELKGFDKPTVRVKAFVALNGRGSRLFIDETVNLIDKQESFSHKDWILPLNEEIYGL